jgi:hypothetical protein
MWKYANGPSPGKYLNHIGHKDYKKEHRGFFGKL